MFFYLQKNPSTIRQPEEDRGRDNYTMTGWVKLPRSMPVSRHISSLCSEAADSTYIRDVDIKTWATRPGNFHFLLVFRSLYCNITRTDLIIQCLHFIIERRWQKKNNVLFTKVRHNGRALSWLTVILVVGEEKAESNAILMSMCFICMHPWFSARRVSLVHSFCCLVAFYQSRKLSGETAKRGQNLNTLKSGQNIHVFVYIYWFIVGTYFAYLIL